MDENSIRIYAYDDSVLVNNIITKFNNKNLVKSFLSKEVKKYLSDKINIKSPEYEFIVNTLAEILTEYEDAHKEFNIIDYDDISVDKLLNTLKKVKIFNVVKKINITLIEKYVSDIIFFYNINYGSKIY